MRVRTLAAAGAPSEESKLPAGSSSPAERSSPASSNKKNKCVRFGPLDLDGSGFNNCHARVCWRTVRCSGTRRKKTKLTFCLQAVHRFIFPATGAENKTKNCLPVEQTEDISDFFSVFVLFSSFFF